MFDISFWKLVLIFAVGLVVLGPEKLPKVAAQLGNWAGQARRMARVLTSQLREEIEKENLRQSREGTAQPAPPPEPAYSRPGLDELRNNAPPDPGGHRDPAPASASEAPRGP